MTKNVRKNASKRKKRASEEEICCSLSVMRFITHIDKILAGSFGWPKIRHSAFSDDTHLVEEVVKLLSGLVDGHDGCQTCDVRAQAQSLNKFKCCRGIESTGRTTYPELTEEQPTTVKSSLVPCANHTSARQCFCDGDSFLLSAGYTSNSRISNDRFPNVPETENSQEDVQNFLVKLFP